MDRILIEKLYEYMMNQEQRARNNVIQLANNVAYRDADYLDHLEMILAQNHFEITRDIFGDIRWIIRTYHKK